MVRGLKLLSDCVRLLRHERMKGYNRHRDRLEEGNRMFYESVDTALLRRLASTHQPTVAILSCSDARVCPEKVFNLSLGDAFEVRVPGAGASSDLVLASLEYAVSHLDVRALVVLGHTDCEAAKAAAEVSCDPVSELIVSDMERAKSLLPPEERRSPDHIAEGNVRLQIRLLQDNSPAIRDAIRSGRLSVMGAMLDVSTGKVSFI